jgi:hypothetical protein
MVLGNQIINKNGYLCVFEVDLSKYIHLSTSLYQKSIYWNSASQKLVFKEGNTNDKMGFHYLEHQSSSIPKGNKWNVYCDKG